MQKLEVLQRYFGHHAFRDGQEALIDGLLAGRDVMGIMPTGGGKSMCYQLPALMKPGVALVVSPLISLMKDQVMALCDAGIPAAYINSTLSLEETRGVFQNARAGNYKILYVAPERLEMDGFVSLALQLNISLVAVDEAHCISQWGQDFRPSYLKIAQFLDLLLSRPPVGAFTATATPEVRQDIAQLLRLRDPVCKVMGFDRPNLYFAVEAPEDKPAAIQALVEERAGKSGIIYCATRAAVERVEAQLTHHQIAATRYHAGLSDAERQQNQLDFQYDRKPIMVATNAFGMGIDKSNVNFVIHYNMPKSLEAYYQEAGRAGRDGSAAECILLYSASDIQTAKFLIQHNDSGELDEAQSRQRIDADMQRLGKMIGYCKTGSCLRGYILDYFGQSHPAHCGNCSNCSADYEWVDITRQAQMILSCIWRIRKHLNYSVGVTTVTGVLRGSKRQKLAEKGLDGLSTYGLMADTSESQLRGYFDALERQNLIETEKEHATVVLTPAASEVLFEGKQVQMRVKKEKAEKRKPSQNYGDLLTRLKALRTRLALKESVPSYIIFSNATLEDMAAKHPHNMEEFLTVNGVGEIKAKRYGEAFLTVLTEDSESL